MKNLFEKNRDLIIKISHAIILALVIVLGTIIIFKNGYGNPYYAAGVRSMTESWHNFFFNSYDPSGFISIDKTPFAFWIQTLFAKIFGYRGWALLLPSLIAQVLSVEIIYNFAKKTAGELAGQLSALFFALTPIVFIMSATNHPDSLLILFLLLSAWSLFKSIDTCKFEYLLISSILLGLAFNTKTLQAFIILPGFILTYLLASQKKMAIKIGELLLSIFLLFAISFSWIIVVDSFPASARPYVGSTSDNSELSLAIGYNGIQRIFSNVKTSNNHEGEQISLSSAINGNGNGGNPGILRLWNNNNGGQIAWFLILAIVGLFILFLEEEIGLPITKKQAAAVFWGSWLIFGCILYSFARFIHPYYLGTLAPAISILSGISMTILIKFYLDGKLKILLPFYLLIGILGQYVITNKYHSYIILEIIVVLAAVFAIIFLYFEILKKFADITIAIALTTLFIFPIFWIGYSLTHNIDQVIPSAGPRPERILRTNSFGYSYIPDKILNYVIDGHNAEKYFFATESSFGANDFIIKTGKPVLVWGGFEGADPALSLAELKNNILNNNLRYIYIQNSTEKFRGEDYVMQPWIISHCDKIKNSGALYDCSNISH